MDLPASRRTREINCLLTLMTFLTPVTKYVAKADARRSGGGREKESGREGRRGDVLAHSWRGAMVNITGEKLP